MEAPLLGTEWIPLPFDACLDPLDLGTEDGLLAFLKSSEFELPEAPVLPQQHFCYEQQQPVASAATPSTSSCAETTAALGPCPSPPTASGPATATATQPVILRQAVARGPRSRCLAAALAQQQQQATGGSGHQPHSACSPWLRGRSPCNSKLASAIHLLPAALAILHCSSCACCSLQQHGAPHGHHRGCTCPVACPATAAGPAAAAAWRHGR